MAPSRNLADDSHGFKTSAPRRGGSSSRLQCGDCRLPIGENGRKKGSVYGFDGGKLVKGRKRHLVVDSQGLLIGVLVTEANASERLGAVVVLDEHRDGLSRLEVVWVDQGYSGSNFERAVR